MPEYSGSLPSFEPTTALWLVPLVPLIAAALCALLRSDKLRPASIALGATSVSLVLLAWKAIELAGLPVERRTLLDVPWTLLRIGSLDVGFAMSLDAGGALIGVAACAAVFATVIELERRDAASRREIGASCLALGSLLLATLGDNLFVMAIGWQGLAAAAYLLTGPALEPSEERARWLRTAADAVPLAALIGGALTIMWGLGGIWTAQGDYVPDFHPRLVHVAPGSDAGTRSGQRELGRGELTIAALPGSKVTLGGAELCAIDERGQRGGTATPGRDCREPARTPFSRLPVPVALHDIQVSPGPGTNDYVIEKTRIVRGGESQIVLTGPTLSFREIEAQLSIRDVSGVFPLRAALTQKKLSGVPLLGLVVVLLVGAALLRVRATARASTDSSAGVILIAAFGGAVAPMLVARTSGVLWHAPGAVSVMAAIAAVLALFAAFGALHQKRRSALIGLAVGSQLLVAIAGGALGADDAALVQIAVLLLATLALVFAAGAHSRVFALGALAISGAPVPLIGAFWSRDGLLWRAFVTTEGVLVPGWITYLVMLAASVLVAYGLWREHFTAARPKQAVADGRAPTLVAALALIVGLALLPLGDPAEHEPGEWSFGPPRAMPPIEATLRHGSLLIGFVLPLGAFLAARRRRKIELPGAALFGEPASARVSEALIGRLERAGAAIAAFDRKLESVFAKEERS